MTHRFRTVTAIALSALLVLACVATPLQAGSAKGRWLKIRVYDKGSTTPTVLLNLPMSLVSAFLRVAATAETHASIDVGDDDEKKTHVKINQVDLAEAIKELESMDPGQIVEIQDGDGRVSIWIE